MDQQDSFMQRNRMFLIAAVVALIVIGAIWAAKGRDDNKNQEEQTNTQNSGSNDNPQVSGDNQNDTDTNGSQTGTPAVSGDVSATGILKQSDNTVRGNYMVVRSNDKVYIATKRDFSSLLDKQVTLNATGTLSSFKFLGFNGSTSTGTDTTAMGGGDTAPATKVSFSGALKASDQQTRGNYMVVSGATKVYLKSVRDYTAWIDQQVTLTANGTLNSFTGAVVNKK